jgi:hypothetical protein
LPQKAAIVRLLPPSVAATECPRQDSNLRHRLRRAVLYPLSYGGGKPGKPSKNQRSDQPAGGGSGEPPSDRSVCSIWMISSDWIVIMARARLRT